MEVTLHMPDGKIYSSDTKKRAAAKRSTAVRSSEIKKTASEVRELIRKSMELEKLQENLELVGYTEWVDSGKRDRFYEILHSLNTGAEAAREYWEERSHLARRGKKIVIHSHTGEIKKPL
jgi:hypothetical protein